MDAVVFARLCLDPNRLVALGRAAEGGLATSALAEALGISRRDAIGIVAELRAAGLVDASGTLNRGVLQEIARSLPRPEGPAPRILEGEWTREELLILSTFFVGERLTEIPSNRTKRRVVLERIAQEFDPGIHYAEADVSRALERYHPDYAALRRYLVEENILSRSAGDYWRSGGRFPLDAPERAEPIGDLEQKPGVALDTMRADVKLVSYDCIAPNELAEIANDERIGCSMTDAFPSPYTVGDAERWIETATTDPPLHFAVVVDGSPAGGVGGSRHKDINTGVAEIGWWLNPAFWGRGIATAAVSRFVRYCFETLECRRVEAGIFVTNTPSTRVAEKAGMTLEGISKDAYIKAGEVIDRLNYGLTRAGWTALLDVVERN